MGLHHVAYFAVHGVDVLDDLFAFGVLGAQQLDVLFIFALLVVGLVGVLLEVGVDVFIVARRIVLSRGRLHAGDVAPLTYTRNSLRNIAIFHTRQLMFPSGPPPCTATAHSGPLSLDGRRCASSCRPGSAACSKNPYCCHFRPVSCTLDCMICSFAIPGDTAVYVYSIRPLQSEFFAAAAVGGFSARRCVCYRHLAAVICRVYKGVSNPHFATDGIFVSTLNINIYVFLGIILRGCI